jgi:protein SCO1/2
MMSTRRLTRMCRSRPIAAIAAALVAIVALGTAAAAQPPASTAMAIPGMTGRFALETPAGNTVTQVSFPGKWLLVYFGYTQCPDACPTALNAIAGAIRDLGPLADQLQPLFITLDPQRDTPHVMADFVKSFDSGMIGLRGSDAETAAAANAFQVYYAVRDLDHSEYAIDYSSFIYVVDPAGRVVALLTGNLSAQAMAEALFRLLL